jgi:hypothetical protein
MQRLIHIICFLLVIIGISNKCYAGGTLAVLSDRGDNPVRSVTVDASGNPLFTEEAFDATSGILRSSVYKVLPDGSISTVVTVTDYRNFNSIVADDKGNLFITAVKDAGGSALLVDSAIKITTLELNDIDRSSLSYLSLGLHTYFNGTTRIYGSMEIEGPSDDSPQKREPRSDNRSESRGRCNSENQFQGSRNSCSRCLPSARTPMLLRMTN